MEFDKFQWLCSAIFESDFDEEVIKASCQEGTFYDLGNLFLVYGIKERRKDLLIEKFKESFANDFNKYKLLMYETKRLRKGENPTLSPISYFDNYMKFNKFVKRKINEKIRRA